MNIGNVIITPPLVLAPMAGVTDRAFRLLVKEQGCGLLVSEMVSCKGLLHNNKKTGELLTFTEFERPFAVQLFGADPEEISRAAVIVEKLCPDIIDINMGCPVPKVVNNGEGAALLRQPPLIEKIVNRAVKMLKTPVMVKIRSGWDEKSINAAEVARAAASGGAAAVAVHARTRAQFYSGQADWKIIKSVAGAVDIPVIGNGDIRSASDAVRMIHETGCAAVMIGRAAEGAPWLFAEISAALKGETPPERPGYRDIFAMLLRHFALLREYKGDAVAVNEMRRYAAAYTRGLPHAARYRFLFNRVTESGGFASLCAQYEQELIDKAVH